MRLLILIFFLGCQSPVENVIEPDFEKMVENAYSNPLVLTLVPRSPSDSILWVGYQVDKFRDLDGKQYNRFSYIEYHKVTLEHWVAFWYDSQWRPMTADFATTHKLIQN